MIIAIDPGNKESAYVMIRDGMKPVDFGKYENRELLNMITLPGLPNKATVVIEMVASYGMAVGKEVFDTCVWIGRFSQAAESAGMTVQYIYRAEEKMALCGNMRARDANIRQALIDKYARHDLKNGKGTKANPDWFYGFKADIWAAYAVAHTYCEKMNGECKP